MNCTSFSLISGLFPLSYISSHTHPGRKTYPFSTHNNPKSCIRYSLLFGSSILWLPSHFSTWLPLQYFFALVLPPKDFQKSSLNPPLSPRNGRVQSRERGGGEKRERPWYPQLEALCIQKSFKSTQVQYSSFFPLLFVPPIVHLDPTSWSHTPADLSNLSNIWIGYVNKIANQRSHVLVNIYVWRRPIVIIYTHKHPRIFVVSFLMSILHSYHMLSLYKFCKNSIIMLWQ